MPQAPDLESPYLYFLTSDQLPVRRSPQGYLETIPKIVVEIRRKNNTIREMHDNLAEFLAAGVVEAWLIDPGREVVETDTATGVRSFGIGDAVVSAVLPEFAATVGDLLAE